MRRFGPPILSLAAMLGACTGGGTRSNVPESPTAAGEEPAEEDRPLVVVIRAEWCAACHHAAPAVAWLREEYGDRADFVDLDVTDQDTSTQSATKASRLGLGRFFEANQGRPGVTILGRNRRTMGRFGAEYRAGPYRAAIEEALATFRQRDKR